MKRETIFALNITIVLVLIGLVMSYSAGIGRPQPGGQIADPMLYLKMHGIYALLGFFLMLFAARLDYRFWQARPVAWSIAGFTVLALIAVLIFGEEVRGARRWSLSRESTFSPANLPNFP